MEALKLRDTIVLPTAVDEANRNNVHCRWVSNLSPNHTSLGPSANHCAKWVIDVFGVGDSKKISKESVEVEFRVPVKVLHELGFNHVPINITAAAWQRFVKLGDDLPSGKVLDTKVRCIMMQLD